MTVIRMDHIGIVVEDLDSAVDFFVALGLDLEGRTEVDGEEVARITAVKGAHSEIAMFKTPDGHGMLELAKFIEPGNADGNPAAPANATGLRHLLFAVDDLEETFERLKPHGAELVGEIVNYKDMYLLCYLRGPDGIIVELAEAL